MLRDWQKTYTTIVRNHFKLWKTLPQAETVNTTQDKKEETALENPPTTKVQLQVVQSPCQRKPDIILAVHKLWRLHQLKYLGSIISEKGSIIEIISRGTQWQLLQT